MKLKLALLVALLLIFRTNGNAQNYQSQQSQLLVYNVGLNALIGGIGGVINKKEGEKWHQAFFKNCAFGGLGGLVKYHSKYLNYQTSKEKNFGLNYLNRAYYYLGHSITNNASLNRGICSNYSFQLYLFNVDVNFTDKIKIKPKISLTTFFFTNFYLINGYKINLNKSLKYGVIYYDRGHTLEKQIAFGSANTIAAIDGFEKKYPEPSIVIPHEMTHTYQFADYYALNYFFEPLHSRMRKNKTMKVLDRFICWDLPFFFLSYHTQNMLKPDPVHYNNFYEFEAQAMATRRYVPR